MNTPDPHSRRPAGAIAGPDSDAASGIDDRADELVRRVVRAAPMPPIPAGFAATVARLAADHQEQARAETLLTLACAAAILLAAAVFALPGLATALVSIATMHDAVPWPMLIAAAATLLLVAGIDGTWRAMHQRRAR
jgi:uncharacterized membrane protein YqjE